MKQNREKYQQEITKINARKTMIEELQTALRKEAEILANYKMKPFSRKLIYDEIWKNGTTKTAKKLNVSYSKFKEACEQSKIPLPSQSYWASLSVGKQVEQQPLPLSDSDELLLPVIDTNVDHTVKKVIDKKSAERKKDNTCDKKSIPILSVKSTTKSKASQTAAVAHEYSLSKDKLINTYDRETLYKEIWSEPIIKVAQRYGVSDVAIHKICKAMDIPKPPAGYWRQLETGKQVDRIPLPPTTKPTQKTGFRTHGCVYEEITEKPILDFLPVEEQNRIIETAQNMLREYSGKKLHTVLKQNKISIAHWAATHPRDISASRKRDSYYSPPEGEPPLYYDISNESLPRVHSFLSVLFYAVEYLGGSVNMDLTLQIRGETVSYFVYESETQVAHVYTKEELRQLEKYEKEKSHSWAYKPRIRKYDYVFNGKLRFSVFKDNCYNDRGNVLIENQLGNILIDLYEKSEVVRIDREAKEAARRKAEEEKRKREELARRKNKEIGKTLALCNEAEDFIIACNIRAYANTMASKPNLTNDEQEWIEWALKKADWFDPIIAREDELLGVREHSKNSEAKSLTEKHSWWY
ncbi:MAG: hypothetical protein U0K87_14795 [Ruminococcus sp.]|nr:hypothetical protein [Ruminococcus sp.]